MEERCSQGEQQSQPQETGGGGSGSLAGWLLSVEMTAKVEMELVKPAYPQGPRLCGVHFPAEGPNTNLSLFFLWCI